MLSPSPGRLRRALTIIVCAAASALPASAQTFSDVPQTASAVESQLFLPPELAPLSGPAVPVDSRRAGSSRMLTSLQVSFGALQALDVISTLRGVNHGFSEANPLMGGLAGHPMAMATVKAGAAASTMLLVRHVAKKNRPAAIAMMAVMNTVLSVVVVRNLRVPGRE